ncbi:MAG: HIT family protein [Candidatus Coprovivens sp.]
MNDCIFCKIVKGEIPSKKLYEDDNVIVIMDVNPQVNGHALVIPKKHVTDYIEADNDTINNVFAAAKLMGPTIMNKLGSKGLTCGINYGDSQAVKHLHLHILPDYLFHSKVDKSTDEVYEILK